MATSPLLLRAAPLLFVAIWSTGFIAAKYSMHNADPFVFLCLRFSITVVVLIPLVLLAGSELPRRAWSYRHDMVTGVLLHGAYLGFVFWPIKNGVPSGIVAIIIGLQPVVTMALASLFIGEQLGARKLAGLLVGFAGISIVIVGKYGLSLGLDGGLDPLDLGMCILSLLAVATGVFYQKKFCDQSHLLPGTMMQYVGGASACAVFALLAGEAWRIEWTTSFTVALVWQVLGLSIGAVVLLMIMLKNGEAGRVSSLFYLVPPLVVIEAHLLFGETLGPLSILGMVIAVAGVLQVNRKVAATPPAPLPGRDIS